MTLIEIMVVVGIIAILVAIFVPVAASVAATAKIQAARGTIASIEAALESYTQFWKPLSPGQRGWKAGVTVVGQNPVLLTIPGLPPLTFGADEAPGWDAYGSQPARTVPGDPTPPLKPRSGQWVNQSFTDPLLAPQFQANQCLAWALTADVGDGPYYQDTGGQTVKTGAYKDPVTDEDPAPGVGRPAYPTLSSGIPTPKVTLVDPWGKPFLYGWEVEVKPNPKKGSNFPPIASFRKAWIASMGPDRTFWNGPSPAGQVHWIGDAKKARGSRDAAGVPIHADNADNIVP